MQTWQKNRPLIIFYILIYVKSFVNCTRSGSTTNSRLDTPKTQISQDLITNSIYTVPYKHVIGPLDSDQFSLFTLDKDDPTNVNVNDNSEFFLQKIAAGFNFKFKYGAKCVKIEYDGVKLWEYDQNISKEYPKLVYVNSDTKTVIVFLKTNHLYVYKFEGALWKFVFDGKPKALELDISIKLSDKLIGYCEDHSEDTATFIAKGKIPFNLVKEYKTSGFLNNYDIVIWETNEITKYAYKVVVGPLGNKFKHIKIYLINGQIKLFGKENNKWVKHQGKIPIELDIKKNSTTDEYYYYDNNCLTSSGTFVAKNDYAFKLLKQSKNLINFTSPPVVIWKAKDKSEYANKVVLTGFGLKFKYVTVYLFNGKNYVFAKDENTPWHQYKGKIPLELNLDTKKSTDQFNFKHISPENVEYTANDIYAFNLVKQSEDLRKFFGLLKSGKVIWQANSKSNYATRVLLDGTGLKNMKLVIFMLNGEILLFSKDNDNAWTQVSDYLIPSKYKDLIESGKTKSPDLAEVEETPYSHLLIQDEYKADDTLTHEQRPPSHLLSVLHVSKDGKLKSSKQPKDKTTSQELKTVESQKPDISTKSSQAIVKKVIAFVLIFFVLIFATSIALIIKYVVIKK